MRCLGRVMVFWPEEVSKRVLGSDVQIDGQLSGRVLDFGRIWLKSREPW